MTAMYLTMLQGPHYVVSSFNVFVCSNCSGIHRQFGHRVKAVSLSSFSTEEVNSLQHDGGNDVFTRTYCATLPAEYVKPNGTSTDLIRNWIEDVYVLKKFYKKCVEGPRPPRLDISSEVVAVVPMTDLFGADTPILHVSLEKKMKEEEEEEDDDDQKDEEVKPIGNLLGDWDPFEASMPSSNVSDTHQTCHEEQSHVQHASFDEPVGGEGPSKSTENNVNLDESINEVSFEDEWESFMSGSVLTETETEQTQQSPVDSYPVPQEQDVLPVEETTRSDARKIIEVKEEIPLEAFYPEFEQIRATGILPTGKPVPWLVRPDEIAPPTTSAAPPQTNPVYTAPPPAPTPPRPTSSTEMAVKALFGTEKNLTAYDLTAPSAAKPAASGNPFG